jgi:hypothetical protein
MDLFVHNNILSFINLIDALALKIVCKDWNILIEHQVEKRKSVESTWIKTSRKLKSLFSKELLSETNIKETFTIASFGIVISVQQIQTSHQIFITDCFKFNYLVYEFENIVTNDNNLSIYYAPFQKQVEIEFQFLCGATLSIFVDLLTFHVECTKGFGNITLHFPWETIHFPSFDVNAYFYSPHELMMTEKFEKDVPKIRIGNFNEHGYDYEYENFNQNLEPFRIFHFPESPHNWIFLKKAISSKQINYVYLKYDTSSKQFVIVRTWKSENLYDFAYDAESDSIKCFHYTTFEKGWNQIKF